MALQVPPTTTCPEDSATSPPEGGGSARPTALHHFPRTQEREKARLSTGTGNDPYKNNESPAYFYGTF